MKVSFLQISLIGIICTTHPIGCDVSKELEDKKKVITNVFFYDQDVALSVKVILPFDITLVPDFSDKNKTSRKRSVFINKSYTKNDIRGQHESHTGTEGRTFMYKDQEILAVLQILFPIKYPFADFLTSVLSRKFDSNVERFELFSNRNSCYHDNVPFNGFQFSLISPLGKEAFLKHMWNKRGGKILVCKTIIRCAQKFPVFRYVLQFSRFLPDSNIISQLFDENVGFLASVLIYCGNETFL
ncbi:uncharacterized protein LOC143249632 [Tachypleus tridentatus]|uniref:uncharacterized protein LOC143249632 n=1 Tax=Tachypleus tridentatus TaxID=6853 RepID=UPI003FD39F59